MSKWTWPALAALLAVASGGYYLLSQRQHNPAAADTDLDVESFGDDSDDGDGGDNTYEMLDEDLNGTASGSKTSTGVKTSVDEGIPTIDDDDDMGQTVKDPVVIDDDEGAVEQPDAQPAPQPKK